MSETNLPELKDSKTQAAPTTTPQALAWHDRSLWMSSRDLRRIYQIDPQTWTLRAQYETPGIPWAAVSTGDSLWLTLGEGEEDDRYLRRFVPGQGFTESDRIACPEFTGSYLSYDGKHLFLSQWYQHRILELVQIMVRLRGGRPGRTIGNAADAWDFPVLPPREKDHPVVRLSRQRRRQMAKLPGHVLVDKQKVHGRPAAHHLGMRRRERLAELG